MKKIILYTAVSIDGYIARTDGSIDWLEQFTEDYGYTEFLSSIDTTIMGNRTYKQVLTFDKFPYSEKHNFVLTNSNNQEPFDMSVEFLTTKDLAIIRKLKEEDGPDIWLIGGGMTNSLFLENELIDEIRLFVLPIILGAGVPVFSGKTHIKKIALNSSKNFNDGTIELRYSLLI